MARCIVQHGNTVASTTARPVQALYLGNGRWETRKDLALSFTTQDDAKTWLKQARRDTPGFIGQAEHHIRDFTPEEEQLALHALPGRGVVSDWDPHKEPA